MTLTAPVVAQDIPAIVDPGRIEDRLEFPETVEPPPQAPEIPVPALVAPEKARDITFELRQFTLEGVTVYSEAELKTHYQDLIGQQISLAEIYDVLDQVIGRYRADGYALVSALIPEQDFATGNVRARMVEGYVSDIFIDGTLNVEGNVKLLEGYAENIIADRPLRTKQLDRVLLLANDIPGLSVDGNVQPARAVPGAVDLHLQADQKKYEFFGNIDNYGPEELGPTQFQIGASVHSLFRLGDTTRFVFGGTPDIDTLRYYLFRHAQIINTSGLTLEFNAAYIETRPDISIFLEDGTEIRDGLEGEAKHFSLRASYPIERSRMRNLFVYGSLDYLDSDNAFLDSVISSDSIRSLRIGALFSLRDAWHGDNVMNMTLSQGLNVIGARAGSRPAGRTDYTKLEFTGQRLQRFGPRFSAVLSTSGQYAFTSLLSPEEFGYGGRRFGRAFRPSELTADHGLAGGLELRYRQPGTGPLRSIEPYAFADAGKVWRRDSAFLIQQQSGGSAGGGMRFQIMDYFTLEAEAARVAYRSRPEIGEQGWRFFFRITGVN